MANKEKYLRTLIRREIRSLLEATDPAVKKAEIDAATAEVKAAEAKKKAAQDKLKAAQALKEDEILLMNLIEAEGDEEEAAAEDEGERH